jgi:hypothetical protein
VDYALWTKTGDGPWVVEEEADRHELARLYYHAREMVRTGLAANAVVHGRGIDPNRPSP